MVSDRSRGDRRNNPPIGPSLGRQILVDIEEEARISSSQRFIFTEVAEASPVATRIRIARYRLTEHRLIGTEPSVAGVSGDDLDA